MASWLTRLLGIDQRRLDTFQDDWQRRAMAPARFVNQNVVQPVKQDIGNFTRGAGVALGQIPAGRIQRDIEAQNAAQQAQLQARIKREQDMAKRQELLRIQQRSLKDVPDARAASLEGAPTGREVAKGALTLASFALPGATVPKAIAKASPAARLLGSSAIRGAEGAAYGAAYDIADGKKAGEVVKNIPRNLAFGAAANVALSPKLTGRAIKEVPELVRDTRAATAAMGRPGFAPGFAKLPGGEKQIPGELKFLSDKAKTMPKEEFVKQLDMASKGQNLTMRETAQNVQNAMERHGLTVDDFYKKPDPLEALKNEEMVTLYHASPKLPTKGNWRKGTYFAPDEQSARYYAESHHRGDIKVQKVEIPKRLLHKNKTNDIHQLLEEYPIRNQLTDLYNEARGASKGKLPVNPVVEPQGIPGQKAVQPQANMPVEGQVPARPIASQQPDIPARNQARLQSQKPLEQPFEQSLTTKQPEINPERLNISPEAKQRVTKTAESIRPELEAVRGKKLTNDEVVEAAKASDILRRGVSRDQTKKATAAITKLRQAVSAGAEGQGISRDFIENLQVLKSYSADAGRTLQAFNIGADPTTATVKERVVKELLDLGKSADDILKAAQNVDFDNPNQVNKFYRQFVKPKIGEIVDEYRYTNLLSSPQTHIVNAFSNMLQGTVVSPATKLYTGGVDFVASALTGKERTAYVSEVPAYTKGFVNALGDAIKNFSDVVKGNKYVERPDIDRLPTGVTGLQTIPRILEAGDIFFRTLIKAGEKESLMHRAAKSGQEIAEDVLDKQAAEKAAYFVFRAPIDPSNQSGQGAVLSSIDTLTNAVYGLRKFPGVKWFIPFVQTPMNILKQGIEYSPAGLVTTIGAKNKTEQIAKSLLGSTVLAGAGMLAMKGDSTWAAPTGTKEKELFYASGRKPYSLKIGDKWYSYSKLGPLAYPIALASAIKYEFEQNPKAQTQDMEDKIGRVVGNMAGFFSDQSYLQGIGDIVRTFGGDASAAKSALSNIPRQLVPLTSLQGWVARMIDPVYRKGETFADSIKTGIPGLSKSVPAYTDPLGRPSTRAYPVGNSFSPIQVTPESKEFEGLYQSDQQERRATAMENKLKKDIEAGKTPGQTGQIGENMYQLENGKVAVVLDGEIKKFDTQEKAQSALEIHDFDQSGEKYRVIGDEFYYKEDGEVKHEPVVKRQARLEDSQYEISKQRLKASEDFGGYMKLLESRLSTLEQRKQALDPDIDQDEIIDLTNKQEDLMAEYGKLKGYGGFTKPKKGKKARATSMPDMPNAPAVPRASISKRARRVAQPAAAQPRVSASYLASGR